MNGCASIINFEITGIICGSVLL